MDTKHYKNNNKVFNNNQYDKNDQKVLIIEKSQDQNNITFIQKKNVNQNVKQKLNNDNISKSGKSDETSIIQNNQNQNTEETSYNLDNINIDTQNYNYNKNDKLYLKEQKSNSSSNNQILYEYDEDETNTNNQNNQKNQHNTLPKSFMQQILQLSEKGSFQLQNFSSNQDEFELYPDQNDEKQQIKELQAKLEVFGKIQDDEENKSNKNNQNFLKYKQNIKPTNKPLMSMQNKNDDKTNIQYEGLKLDIDQQNSQLKSIHQIQNKKVICKKNQQVGQQYSQKEIKQQKPIKSYTQFNCLYTQPQHESQVVSLQEIDNFDSQTFQEKQGKSLLQDLSYFKQNGYNGFEKKKVKQQEQFKNHQKETEIDKNSLNQSDIQLDQEEQNHEPKAKQIYSKNSHKTMTSRYSIDNSQKNPNFIVQYGDFNFSTYRYSFQGNKKQQNLKKNISFNNNNTQNYSIDDNYINKNINTLNSIQYIKTEQNEQQEQVNKQQEQQSYQKYKYNNNYGKKYSLASIFSQNNFKKEK